MRPRVRIAPSPTGDPHVGTAYMAVFNYLYAKRFGGDFILRIEDTDQTRSRPEYEKNIFNALTWCGLAWTEGPDVGGPYGPYRQSERTEIYRRHTQDLLERGQAYKCFCTPQELAEMREIASKRGGHGGYDRRCRTLTTSEIREREKQKIPYVVRLKVPTSGECAYEDLVHGRIVVPWSDIDDQVLLKSDGFPTYHLANVVDDHLMRITHVIRGDEWMTSTPKHICLYNAFGWIPPAFIHMPLLLGKDGKKLSKRKNPTSIFYFRDSGYLPEALLNFLTLMGYSMPENREKYSLEEIAREFDPKRIGTSGAFFDIQKLDWLNQKYIIESVPQEGLWDKIQEWGFRQEFIHKLMPLIHTRIKNFGDFIRLCDFFFINDLSLTPEKILPKNTAPEAVVEILQCLIWRLDELEDWSGSALERASHEVAEAFAQNHKKVVMALLFPTITGKSFGPPLFESVTLLGKERTRARLMHAIELAGGISNKKAEELKKTWAHRNRNQIEEKRDR